jgi:hypothetical protein
VNGIKNEEIILGKSGQIAINSIWAEDIMECSEKMD